MKPDGSSLLILSEKASIETIESVAASASMCEEPLDALDANEQPQRDQELVHSLLVLITEGRTPEPSSKRGYKEGVHVAATTPASILNANLSNSFSNSHQCNFNNTQCQNSYELKHLISAECLTNKPASIATTTPTTPPPASSSTSRTIIIDVCQLGDCCNEALGGRNLPPASATQIVERWRINYMPETCTSSSKFTFADVYQAVRSYLHFSQISSWLNQSRGLHPHNLAYSVYNLPSVQQLAKLPHDTDTHSFPHLSALSVELNTRKRCQMSSHVTRCAPESPHCLQHLFFRRSLLKMSSRSAVEFGSAPRVPCRPRRKSVDFGDEFPMLGTEMAEMRPRDASPSPGERRRMSLGCERNAKSRKVDDGRTRDAAVWRDEETNCVVLI